MLAFQLVSQRPLGDGVGDGVDCCGAGEGEGALGTIGIGPAPLSCWLLIRGLISLSHPTEPAQAQVPGSYAGSEAGALLPVSVRFQDSALGAEMR